MLPNRLYAQGVLQSKSECCAFRAWLCSWCSHHSDVCLVKIWCHICPNMIFHLREYDIIFYAIVGLEREINLLKFIPRPLLWFITSSISLCPHRTPPDGGARCSPLNLRGCYACHPTCGRRSRHVPVSTCSDKPHFGRSIWTEQGTPVCRLQAFLVSSWHWCAVEWLHSLCAV